MKHIVEYKLQAGSVPYFIEDGGYFPEDGKLIGVTHDDYECFIPKLVSEGGDLKSLTNKEFIDMIVSKEIRNPEGELMTDKQKEEMACNWIKQKGV